MAGFPDCPVWGTLERLQLHGLGSWHCVAGGESLPVAVFPCPNLTLKGPEVTPRSHTTGDADTRCAALGGSFPRTPFLATCAPSLCKTSALRMFFFSGAGFSDGSDNSHEDP